MSRPSNCQYRGKGALKEEKVASEPAPTITKQKTAGKRGGTIGQGTRGGTKRAPAEQLAYDSDEDGVVRGALTAALIVYNDPSARSQVCASGGRHQNGLVLKRPRAPLCSVLCECDANTSAMAGRIGALPLKVSCQYCTSNPCVRPDVTVSWRRCHTGPALVVCSRRWWQPVGAIVAGGGGIVCRSGGRDGITRRVSTAIIVRSWRGRVHPQGFSEGSTGHRPRQ